MHISLRWIAVIASSLGACSCAKEEVDMEVAWFGSMLPNYCERSGNYVQVLEAKARTYGLKLTEMGYVGRWDGLLHAMACHHFIWGDFAGAERVGREYLRSSGSSGFVEYDLARVLQGIDVRATVAGASRGERAIFADMMYGDAEEIERRAKMAWKRFADWKEFEAWANGALGPNAMLVLTVRVQATGISEKERLAIVRTLAPFFVEGETLRRFAELAKDYAPWVTEKWLSASLLYERHWRRESRLDEVEKIRAAREFVAKGLVGTDSEAHWVSCVLEGKGVFAVQQ